MGKGGSVFVREGAVMPEDAPGNPGAVPGSPAGGRPVMYGKVREMQAKLHRWAGQDQSRRFGDLFNLVCDPDFLAEAWFRVKANTGTTVPICYIASSFLPSAGYGGWAAALRRAW
jgi:hypothetical protein